MGIFMRDKLIFLLKQGDINLFRQAILLNESLDIPLLEEEEIFSFFCVDSFKDNWDIGFFLLEKFEGRGFESLQALYLNYIEMFSLPDAIGRLKNLEILNLHRTRISSLSDAIGQLKNLEELHLNGDCTINCVNRKIG